MTKPDLPRKVRQWSETPVVNPRYKGATPADVARVLLGQEAVEEAEKGRQPEWLM